MFESLSEKFDSVFRRITGQSRLTEENIQAAMREVRMALLEADVNFKVVKDFTNAVSQKAVGTEVLQSVRPSQMFIKIVHDELVAMMGGAGAAEGEAEKAAEGKGGDPMSLMLGGVPGQGAVPFELRKGHLNTVLMLGLQGSGKTTFTGKLALRLKKAGFNPLLVACDIHRPAAIDQLQTIGRTVGVPVFEQGTQTPAATIAAAGMAEARRRGCDVVLVDTAGRLHIDEVRMDELQAVKTAVKPDWSFLVADAMTGQDAVNSAKAFDDGVGIDGVCLTKLDGDARGGAALSIRAVTGKPIFFVGVGEKPEDLEPFHPDRMAQRILGMGDVLTLVEKAQESIDEKEAAEIQEKMRKEQFTLQDFLTQMNRVKKMGPLKSLMGMLPGVGQALKGIDIPDDAMKPMEAMIQSMTPEERANPELLNASRRKRIARGSGREVSELNDLIREFMGMRKMMSALMGGGLKGMMGGGARGGRGGAPGMPAMPRGGPGAMGMGPGGDPFAPKNKPKHRRIRKTRKKK